MYKIAYTLYTVGLTSDRCHERVPDFQSSADDARPEMESSGLGNIVRNVACQRRPDVGGPAMRRERMCPSRTNEEAQRYFSRQR